MIESRPPDLSTSNAEELRLGDRVLVVRNSQQVSCGLSDGAAVLSLKNGTYYGLNPVGAAIWQQIEQPRLIGDLLAWLENEYASSTEQLRADLELFLKELARHGLVDVDNSARPEIPAKGSLP